MASPTAELQGKIITVLKTDTGVTALATSGVYDRVSASVVPPYVSMGAFDELSEDADCLTFFDISVGIDCWSIQGGKSEVSKLADAVRVALRNADLTLADNALVLFRHVQTRIFMDADGSSWRAAMTFNALVEQPA